MCCVIFCVPAKYVKTVERLLQLLWSKKTADIETDLKFGLFDEKIRKNCMILVSDASSSSQKEKCRKLNFAAFTSSLKFHIGKKDCSLLYAFMSLCSRSYLSTCSKVFPWNTWLHQVMIPLFSSCELTACSFIRRKAPDPPEDLQLQNKFSGLTAVKGLGALSNVLSVFGKPESGSSKRGKWQVLARDGGPSSSAWLII